MEALARLPVFYALTGKRAVVAGGSAAAAWKAELLVGGRRELSTCYAAEAKRRDGRARARARRASRFIRARSKPPTSTAPRWRSAHSRTTREAAAFAALARRAGVPVNVIDKPAFCDFSFGAIVNRSPLVIGISTDGAAPVFGQAIRAKLEALIPRGFARWAEAARQWRPRVQALALSFRERRRFWEQFTERAVAEPERAPTTSDIDALMAETRGVPATPARSCWSAPAPAIRSCSRLRAVRALAVRRRHPDRRSGVTAGARLRAPRGEEDDGRQDRPRARPASRARSTS